MLVGVTDISNHDGSWSEYKVAEGGAKAGLSGCNIFWKVRMGVVWYEYLSIKYDDDILYLIF